MFIRLFFFVLVLLTSSFAQAVLMSGVDLREVNLDEALQTVSAGTVVVLGEMHGKKTHQNQHMAILDHLRQKGFKISVGLEFFSYPDQEKVTAYGQGSLAEADFLKQIGWGNTPFEFYRDQALFPVQRFGEKTIALNAPRSLTGDVAKGGLQSLSPDQLALLPPGYHEGQVSYRRRFENVMSSGHLPPEKLENYFQAQSIWDDTMAWKAQEFVQNHPDQVLVIVVGEFHVQYGGGLPDRLHARGLGSVITFSQILTGGLNSVEISNEINPSPTDGPRAQWLWVEEK